ncbi:MAG: hypothetical protein OXR73_35935, partial [Myxococcales bacterium]|nr:hypothetical protein [Myxococcales bacterium]
MTKRTFTRPAHTGMCILMLLAACSEAGTVRDDVGAVHFNVELADGSELIELAFRIDGNGIPPIEGVIPAAEAGATLSAAVGELPPGTGYTLSLTGTSSSGQACSGHATFDILANETTTLTVALRCGAAQ